MGSTSVIKGLLALGLYNYIDSGLKVVMLMLVSLVLLPVLSSHFSKIIASNMMNPLGSSSKAGFTGLVLANKTVQSDIRSSRH
jgi:hypothetical protein